MISRDLYNTGNILEFKNGEPLLERTKYTRTEDISDQIHTIVEGDTLTSIANKYYQEPLYWYLIADINEIFNPFELEIGTNIIIPNLMNYL